MKIDTVDANGLTFAYLEAGRGPLALCLHGFPDSAHTWRHLLPALADAGYRAVAPFQRGYAPTEVPADGAYQTGALAADANALHEALGGDGDAVLIGHDWGATADVRRGGARPDALAPGGHRCPSRRRRRCSSAVLRLRPAEALLLHVPLPDAAGRHGRPANDLAFIDRLWADWSPGYDAHGRPRHVKACLRDPANLAARSATTGRCRLLPARRRVRRRAGSARRAGERPILYLHGGADGCLDVGRVDGRRAAPPAGFAGRDRARRGHFLHLEQPATVNGLVLDWLAGSAPFPGEGRSCCRVRARLAGCVFRTGF